MNLAARLGLVDRCFDLESVQMAAFLEGRSRPEYLPRPAGAVLWLKSPAKIVRMLTPAAVLPVIGIDPIAVAERHAAYTYCAEVQKHFPLRYPENISDLLPEREHGQPADYVILHPGSGGKSKNFSLEFYLDLKSLLSIHGLRRIIFLLGPAEKTIPRRYLGDTEILEPGTVLELSSHLEKARLYVGNDSGVSHLAGFLGVPSAVFYRATAPALWGVIGKNVHHIRARDEETARRLFLKFLKKLSGTG
jgi:hypothetical protein